MDQALLESGKAMGMTKFQVLRMVELPLAMSVIMAGLRTALVITIGIATIGTFMGAGGLGRYYYPWNERNGWNRDYPCGCYPYCINGRHCRHRNGMA